MSCEQQVPRIVAVEATTVTPRVEPDLVVHGARGTHSSSPFALVRVTCDDGAVGYGEISATPLWSGEDGVTAAHFTRTLLRDALVGQPLAPVAALTARLDRALAANPFTKAGVNTALWDALGRSTGLPVTVLLGGPFRDTVPVKLSLSGDEAAIEAGHAAAAFGLETIIGSNMEGDLGAAAQLHVACAIEGLSATIPSDVAGPLYYAERFAAEPVAIDGVVARLPAGPGLGVVPSAELEQTFR